MRFSRIPTPAEVFSSLQRQFSSGRVYADIALSVRRIMTGFVLAGATGVALGVAIGRSRVASDLLRPILEVIRPIPAIAWVPIAILLMPSSEQAMVFITYLAAFFPILVSTLHAVRSIPTVWEDAVLTMGARRMRVITRVVLPASLPGIFSGLSVGMGVAWICVISAEMISGQFGIGYYTWYSYSLIDYPAVVVGMLLIGLLGWGSAATLELVGGRATRWLPRNAGSSA